MERVGIFVDGANIYYGLKGKRLDFAHFKQWLANGREISQASYFNAWQRTDSNMQRFFEHVKKSGFGLYVKQTTKNSVTHQWKQSGVDVYLTVKAMKYSKDFDTFVLVAGDYDYVPLVDEMLHWGKKIEVVSFKYCMHPIYNKWLTRHLDEYVDEYALETNIIQEV